MQKFYYIPTIFGLQVKILSVPTNNCVVRPNGCLWLEKANGEVDVVQPDNWFLDEEKASKSAMHWAECILADEEDKLRHLRGDVAGCIEIVTEPPKISNEWV